MTEPVKNEKIARIFLLNPLKKRLIFALFLFGFCNIFPLDSPIGWRDSIYWTMNYCLFFQFLNKKLILTGFIELSVFVLSW